MNSCGHLRVYHAQGMSEGEFRERRGSCLFCDIERLTTALENAARPEVSPYWVPRSWHNAMMDNMDYGVRRSEQLIAALKKISTRYLEAVGKGEQATGDLVAELAGYAGKALQQLHGEG